jgi:Xaa-Pro aminopeptidase
MEHGDALRRGERGRLRASPCSFDGPDGLEGLYPAVQQGGGERRIEAHVPILVDFVGAAGGYLADRTRIFSIGDPPPEAQGAQAACIAIVREIEAMLRPGAIPSAIHARAVEIAKNHRGGRGFMGWSENRVGFVGHGVGLDLDELPVLAPRFDEPLAAGHVLAIEPKFFLEGIGGAGVENTYVVTEHGFRNLTPGPEEIRIV